MHTIHHFTQEYFNNFILNNNVIGFFKEPITLKSGRKSHWYVNWRNVTEDVYLTGKLVEYLIAFTKDFGQVPDSFFGVPEGATKLATIAQYRWAKCFPNFAQGSHALAMGRGKSKSHGTPKDRYFLGIPKGKTIILEDVTTTGSSLLNTLENLTEAGVEVTAAFGLTDRKELNNKRQSVEQILKSKGTPYYSLSNASQLLPLAIKKYNPDKKIIRAIEKEFQQYGIEPLKLS